MQSINQLFRDYPYLFPTVFVGLSWIYAHFFGAWQQLAVTYGYKDKFVGQTWKFQYAAINRSEYKNSMTVGINSTGLYLAPFALFRTGHPPILMPWAELQIEEERTWAATMYALRPNSRPQIKIQITDDLFKKLETSAGGQLPIGYPLEMRQRQAAEASIPSIPPADRQFKIQGKLVAKISAVTFAIGLFFGGVNHGVAHYQAWQHPDRYKIYFPGQYTAPDPRENWPQGQFEFLGLSAPVYVLVDQGQSGSLTEKYYSIFGSVTEVRYRDREWIGTGGGNLLSMPIYTFSCLLPFAGGWLSLMLSLAIFGNRKQPDADSKAAKQLTLLFTIIGHSIVAGVISLLIFTISSTIAVVIQAVK
jgi:hypothetical protein